jgi:hypothetical protein
MTSDRGFAAAYGETAVERLISIADETATM